MHISLGRGDTAVLLCTDRDDKGKNGISFIKRFSEYPIAIDVDCDVTNEEVENGTLGHITFSDPNSIDAVISMLQRLQADYGQQVEAAQRIKDGEQG